MKAKVEELREALKKVEELTNQLTLDGAIVEFCVASDQKTVNVKTLLAFSMEVKVTINQEL